MDVRCERCGTEYEFDDALVSGRGTTVKCTNCGHKFKIRRSDGDYSEDFWNVRTGDGRTLVFTSLRELQRAIQAHQVERNDMLSRGGLPPKAIGGIPELAPFFDQRDAKDAQGGRGGTLPPAPPRLDGHDPNRRSRPPPPPGAVGPALAPPRQRQSTRPDFPAPPAILSPAASRTIPGTGEEPAVAPPFPEMRARMGSVPPREGPDAIAATAATVPASPAPAPHAAAAPPKPDFARTQPLPPHMRMAPTLPGVAPPGEGSQKPSNPPPLPGGARSANVRSAPPPPVPARSVPPPVPARRPSIADDETERVEVASANGAAPRASERRVPAAAPPRRRSDPDAGYDDRSSPLPPRRIIVHDERADDEHEHAHARRSVSDIPAFERRRPVGGYIVALVVVLGVGALGVWWARNNLGALSGPKPPASAAVDPRIATFLATGEQALAEGNLELAKESFDKASVVAERDPRVLLDIARLTAARADVLWLKSRLLPTDAADEHRLVRDGLAELAQNARKAADEALAVAPEDPAALRAKIDALRISGDREGARALVAKLSASSAQPETAYVLAALDLAEAEPLWPTVVERLRTAAATESGPGRARAALVYALARSGDAAGAKAEVDRLAAMTRQHPLLPQLRAFADRARAAAPVAKPDAGAIAAATPSGTPSPAVDHKPGAGGGAPSGDPRVLVAQAEAARNRRDFDKARMLYSAALDKNPNDSEALHGLAAISHAQHDLSGARASYKRVLSINPTYLPALVGLADVDWESGDRAAAAKTYREIVDRFPEGTYPGYVKQRLEAASAPKPAPAPTAGEQGGGG